MEQETTEQLTEYINILSDFGFKFVFGNEKNKGALIRFLNILFAGKLNVTDVTFRDKEVLPASKDGKRIVYDVYCTMVTQRSSSAYYPDSQTREKKGEMKATHHFILEMQNIYIPPFEERLTYYACKMVAGQGVTGWNYELEPVFTVAITNFNFPHLSPKLFHDMMIMDTSDHEPLTDKVHIFLCSLEEVPSTWEECETELEKALFLIKNMENMSSTSLAYREGNFNEFFEAARSSRLSKDDIIPYKQSVEYLRDTQRGIDYAIDFAKDKLRAEGRAEGLAEGLVEGRKTERLEIARKCKKLGMDLNTIAETTGLSIDVIAKL